MPINQDYINRSIDTAHRTAFLCQQIKCDHGPFVERRRHLNGYTLVHMLKKNGYTHGRAMELNTLMQTHIENAYARGVFVVASRTVSTSIDVDTPEALLTAFRTKEQDAFTPCLWYPKDTYTDLLLKRYRGSIARELGPYLLRQARVAFAQGMKTAAKALVQNTMH